MSMTSRYGLPGAKDAEIRVLLQIDDEAGALGVTRQRACPDTALARPAPAISGKKISTRSITAALAPPPSPVYAAETRREFTLPRNPGPSLAMMPVVHNKELTDSS
jgi:hypothetical protein